MSESQVLSPRGVVAATHGALLAGDVDAFVRWFAEGAVLEFPFSSEPSLPPHVAGRESIRLVAPALGERLRRGGPRRAELEGLVVRETVDPEVLVVELGAMDDPGADAPDIQVWRVRNGEVLSMREYLGVRARTPSSGVRPLGGSSWG